MEEFVFIHPKYVSDMVKLETFFSEKIWLLIFKNISESDHYHSIYAGSPYFHKLLLPLRVKILFPEVIKLCFKSTVLTDESYFTLLHCRAVCKAWKQGVDDTFHQILSETNADSTDWKRFGFSAGSLNANQRRILFEPNICKEDGKLDKFLELFHNSHFLTGSNPFPSRSIGIYFASKISSTVAIGKLLDLLKIYGHHIRHCYVMIWCRSLEEMEGNMQIFRNLLRLLPNLQTLRIGMVDFNVLGQTSYLENLSENPLPKLDKLQFVSEHDYIPGPIFSQLIQTNSHIKKLGICGLNSKDHSALFTTPLPNLEELHISGFRSPEDFSRFTSVPVQWPLRKLTLLCDCVLHVNIVLNFVEERWADTLTGLSIIIPAKVSVGQNEPPLKLKLPCLETLKIQIERYSNLDFILHLTKSLVSLSIHHSGTEDYRHHLEKDSNIKFFLHRDNLGRSNIWKFFPRLRKINYADEGVYKLRKGRLYRRNHWLGPSSEGI